MGCQLFTNPDKCTGCNRCAYACSVAKEGRFQPSNARLQINNFPLRGYSVPNVCFQCLKADCMESCPTEAFSRNGEGVVSIDPAKCTGCGACTEACTYGMVELDESRIANKCDYCSGDPACVKECHTNALLFEPADFELIRLKAAQMRTRIDNGSPTAKRLERAKKVLKNAR